MIKISEEWDEILKEQFSSLTYLKLREFLKSEYSTKTIYPDMHDIFNSMKKTSFNDIKVVLIGQDPYHEYGQAMGLSFSVPKGIEKPPSLVNIFKEIEAETGEKMRDYDGDLTGWANQGVLLLNTVLTVREHQANSHKDKGWEEFTDGIIKKISSLKENVVFFLWGANARAKKPLIDASKHLILECAHPSPLSAYNGFFGCGHFIKANEYLIKHGKMPIIWNNL
ncbi:MAG: uracil-DNA glycosylase [Clostridia bacterium]|nr:uracil-DNA glycosylase [Clostridia bacterium]